MTSTLDTTYDYDVLVIGAGPGGYVAAIRAAQLGFKTACVESRKTLGGTCLNVGCIPSKALLHASHLYEEASSGTLERFGIQSAGVKLDLSRMQGEKNSAVNDLTQGIAYLFKKNKVKAIEGRAKFLDNHSVEVEGQIISAKNIIIATGSTPKNIPNIEIDGKTVLDSTSALALSSVPKHMVVVGAGVIGLELGSVWRRLGAKVTVVEYLPNILPGMDADVCAGMHKILAKQGMVFKTATKVSNVDVKGSIARVTLEPANTQKNKTVDSLEADAVLIAIGRQANTEGLNIEAVNIALNAHGQIPVDHDMKTSAPNIWAIGDVTPGAMLAHRAEDEGIIVAENIARMATNVNHDVIPSVVYTMPEVASVDVPLAL